MAFLGRFEDREQLRAHMRALSRRSVAARRARAEERRWVWREYVQHRPRPPVELPERPWGRIQRG